MGGKSLTFPSDSHTEWRGHPLGPVFRETGQNREKDTAWTAHLERGNLSLLREIFRDYWCSAAPTLTRTSSKSFKNFSPSRQRLTAPDRCSRTRQTSITLLTLTLSLCVLWRQKCTVEAPSCHTGIDMFLWG